MLWLRQICLVARELDPAVEDLKAVFGLETCHHDPNVGKYGLENALLPIGPNFLEVVAPFREGTTAGRYLDRRSGDGGYMVIMQCDDAEAREKRMPSVGVRVMNRLDYGDYLGLQLHPKDTGAAILETSEHRGDHAAEGPWHPAGSSWEDAVRTDVTTALVAAELQTDDPNRLAARWSEVLDVELGEDGAGNPALALENASLRFVVATDGRGEGLGGLDLIAADRDAVVRNAAARGCAVEDDMIIVCGTRFNLKDA